MRTRFEALLIGGIAAVLAGCGGIGDCKEDGAKCAAMLNSSADKCAVAFQLKQSDEKRKFCENAVKVVGTQRVKEALPALLAMLAVPESTVTEDKHRQAATKAIAAIGDPSAVEPLLAAIDFNAGASGDPRDKNANLTNEEIATALGVLRDKRAVPKLIDLAQKSKHNYAQLNAVRSLGLIGDPAAVEPLAQIALEHENKFIRKNAIEALGALADPRATDALIQAMFIEYQGVSFYREASFALFQIGPPVADALLATMEGKNEKVNKYFEKSGGLKSTAVKAKCGYVLGDLRDRRAVKPLLDAFTSAAKDNDPVVLVYTATPLGALGDPAAVPALKAQMMDLDTSKRDPIMRAINQIGDRSVAPDMIAAMTRQSFIDRCVKLEYGSKQECGSADNKASIESAQKTAADNASNLAGAEHYDAFKKVVDAEAEPSVKDYLAKRLARVEAARECKLDAACWSGKLKSEDPLIREKAAWELGRIKDPSSSAALAEALGDKKPEVRSAAIAAYFNYGDAAAVPAIEKRLDDELAQADFIRVNEDLKRLLVALKRKKA